VNSVDGLSHGAYLIELDQGGVAALLGNGALDVDWIGHQQVVADNLNVLAQNGRLAAKALPVVLRETILERYDRKAIDPTRIHGGHFVRALVALSAAGEAILAVLEERRSGRIKCDRNVLAGSIMRAFNRSNDQFARLLVTFKLRGEAAFIPDRRAVTSLVQQTLKRLKSLGTVA